MRKSIKNILLNVNKNYLDDTKYLLCHILNFNKAQIIANNDYLLTTEELIKYEELSVKCFTDYYPLSYITGFKEFYSRKFKVTKDTLIPRPETEFLVDLVLTKAKNKAKILDMGTGTGIIAITCKLERPDLKVFASEKYDNTLSVAKENSIKLRARIKFITSDWFSNIKDSFDIIVVNPPYIDINNKDLKLLKHEPLKALTDYNDGLNNYREILSKINNFLFRNGYLFLEHGFDQGKIVTNMMCEAGFINIVTIKDYANLDRVTYGMKNSII